MGGNVRHDSRADPRVSVTVGSPTYDASAPFCPGTLYPEYAFGTAGLGSSANHAYAGVREALALLGLDGDHFGQDCWNPLSGIVQPGDSVVLKPNFVRDFRESVPDHGDCLITHGSVIRAALDFVYIALRGEGRIIIADAPQNDADFEAIKRIVGLDEIQEFYRKTAGFDVEVYDLRPERADKIDGVIVGHVPLPGDPAGYATVDLGTRSALWEINGLCHLLYGSEYDTSELHRHQHDDVHEYCIAKTILNADCVIGLPKMKTHKKTGLTANLKNLVGINGNKNWLPHHREGTRAEGGDQFADDGMKHRVERAAVSQFKRVFPSLGPLRPVLAGPIKAVGKRLFGDTNTGTIRSGNWYGNDTTWRMVVDLNRVLLYADAEGRVRDEPVRKFFSIVDGIVGGEGNGPLDATPKAVGLVLAGANPVAVDVMAARLMGFDYRRIPVLTRAFGDHPLPLVSFASEDVVGLSNEDCLSGSAAALRDWHIAFEPHFGWKGHVELDAARFGAVSETAP